jgi:CheY-like chemotaxis protein
MTIGLILIVEDEFGLAEVMGQLLLDSGYDVAVAVNGTAALAHMDVRRPDLVLVDLMMPILDGPGLVRRMRADPALAQVPVVLMTALPGAVPADIIAIVQGVLAKPFTQEALMAAVASLQLQRE